MLLSWARPSVRSCTNSVRCRHLRSLALAPRLLPTASRRGLSAPASSTPAATNAAGVPSPLPVVDARAAVTTLSACSGCGALAQTVESGEAGYFDLTRASVRGYLRQLGATGQGPSRAVQNATIDKAMDGTDPDLVLELKALKEPPAPPLCDRCHGLLHHHTGVSVHHPSIDSLRDTIAESPYKINTIYHVLDAADFPMSLVSSVSRLLSAAPLRTKNRRAKDTKYSHGKKTEMSFIITRADLLAPTKEKVDKLMPYLVDVLRDALGQSGRNMRLGNVRCVSAKRGWWTKELKADVWHRGGAGWMVGKVNVGKSNLFEVAFPKGRAEDINFDGIRSKASEQSARISPMLKGPESSNAESLLPPARLETPYPVMPTVSSLPGTTASPIRLPFGNGRGELIDLPGLARSDLESFVQPARRDSLLMKSRIKPEQQVLKPRGILVLGGLIALTPRSETLNMMVCPFLPLKSFTYSDHSDPESSTIERRRVPEDFTVAAEGVTENLESAGRFQLKWDVTKQRAGPLTRKDAVGLSPSRLPFKVLSADILIEGVGWIEVAVQVRRKDFPDEGPQSSAFPEIEVFSPEGRFVSVRKPMGAWSLCEQSGPSRRVRPALGARRFVIRNSKQAREKRRGLATPRKVAEPK